MELPAPGSYAPELEPTIVLVDAHFEGEKISPSNLLVAAETGVLQCGSTREGAEAVALLPQSSPVTLAIPQFDTSVVAAQELLDHPVKTSMANNGENNATRETTMKVEEELLTKAGLRSGATRPKKRCIGGIRKTPAERTLKRQKKEREDVCFICFGGVDLVPCGYWSCPKVYHPLCVGQDEAFLCRKGRWNCGWHICSNCESSAQYKCFTCTYSFCKCCIKEAEFILVRGNEGLCITCMHTIMMIDTEDGKTRMDGIDFEDKNSFIYLFKSYWLKLKAKPSLTLEELIRDNNRRKGSVEVKHARLQDYKEGDGLVSDGNSSHQRGAENQSNDYAAIDMHNIHLMYLPHRIILKLIKDAGTLWDKVVGAFVRIKISPGSSEREDVYRLVRINGLRIAIDDYRTSNKITNILLEVQNQDKEEITTIDNISNQEFTEEECKCLRQIIKCGFISLLTVGEVREKAQILQSVRVIDWMRRERLELAHLRDQASKIGCKEEYPLIK